LSGESSPRLFSATSASTTFGSMTVLAEHDDADAGVRLAQPAGCLDSLVGVARRHPDVGEDDVGTLLVDRGEQRVEIAADGGDVEGRFRFEQSPDALADEVVVVGEHEPDRHA
jgi:hypothetical protein